MSTSEKLAEGAQFHTSGPQSQVGLESRSQWKARQRASLGHPEVMHTVEESLQAREPGLQAPSNLAGSKTKITKLFGRLNVS